MEIVVGRVPDVVVLRLSFLHLVPGAIYVRTWKFDILTITISKLLLESYC